jgi:hypothetical protein
MARLRWSGSLSAVRQYERALIEHPPRLKRKRRNRNKAVPQKPIVMPYEEYLCSRWWRSRRREKLKKAGWRCNKCGSTKDLQVHHKNYLRLWRERDKDLEVLCRGCHEGEHEAIVTADRHLRSIAAS